jgi:signal peptidase
MRSVRRPTRPTIDPIGIARLIIEIAVLAVIAIGLGGIVVGRGLPAVGHPVFVVAGPSMAPAIDVGAAVILETVPPGDLRVGDVVSLRSGPARAVFTHRIVRIAERDGAVWLETKGDANAEADPSLTAATEVVGRVAVVLPVAGYALTVLTAPPGVLLVISTGLLLLLAGWWLESVADERRRPGPSPVEGVVPRPRAPAPLSRAATLRAERARRADAGPPRPASRMRRA